MSTLHAEAVSAFSELGLSNPVLKAVEAAGYETPTPVQLEVIPHILSGHDVVGLAQTGTGKTAAFALPMLSMLHGGRSTNPQILVLAPTRELALQVAEAFKDYGKNIKNFSVVAIFGGQEYGGQIKQLQAGPQVVVGTPGRIMDHLRKGTLDPSTIHSLVLDEADEMLKMGFLDDVEWILEQLPAREQTALFSATMPPSIRNIAMKYLVDPVEVTIRSRTASAWLRSIRPFRKADALTKILEVEDCDGVLVFVRTKVQTMELAERLAGFGYSVAALNGDIEQSQRLRTVDQLKSKKINILVATDVAARGLDVDRISHVVNFDIPFDTEAYIHRIGRTGRAGRSGEAILFVNGREKSMLKAIEKATRQKISSMNLPTARDINRKRIADFKRSITAALSSDLSFYEELLSEYLADASVEPVKVAAALASIARQDKAQLLRESEIKEVVRQAERRESAPRSSAKGAPRRGNDSANQAPDHGMERYRIEVGHDDGIKPGNIVGAIANEADIDSKHIGRIEIFENFSTVDLPFGMPFKTLKVLQRARIYGKMLKMQKAENGAETASDSPQVRKAGRKPAGAGKGKGPRKARSAYVQA